MTPLYTFAMTIPAAPNNPSDDQPSMLINNMSTFGLINQDHVPFNQDNGGQHKSITFNNFVINGYPYLPVPPVNPPELFINNQDGVGNNLPEGLAQLFYYSGPTTTTTTQYVSAAQGSAVLFGGVIIKWGSLAVTGSPVSFVSPFPNNCWGVQITGNASPYLGAFNATNVTVAGFTAQRTSGTGATGYYYFSIGN
jgi:hypothetical protein